MIELLKTPALTRCVAFGVVLALCAGCSGAPETAVVSGSVTFDGDPVAEGQVAFEPQSGGRMAYAVISKGEYRTPKDRGVEPGTYLVRITASRPTGKLAEEDSFIRDEASAVVNEQFIPAKYNSASGLTVEIKPGASAVHDFELTSK
jgi:hypothetical protein